MTEDNILGYECKFAIHCPAVSDGGNDLHFIKETIHYKDGTTKPNTRLKMNYKRDFYITKKEYRNHLDKKEYEDLNKLQKFTCTESNLTNAVARALATPGLKTNLRKLARSQYLYGADITSTAILKKEYMQRWPDLIAPNTVAAFDIETDVVEGHEEPIMIGLTFGNKRIISIVKSFLGTMLDPETKFRKLFTKYLSEYETPDSVLIFDLADSPAQAIKNVIDRAHEWKPDLISIWNINFDLPRILEALKKENYDWAEIFSDPSIPAPMRFANWIQGKDKKVTQSGKITPIHWTEQWHTMSCPASFYFIDAGCVYRRIRMAKGMEPSYKLDDILHKNIGLRKLAFDDLLENEAPHIRSGTLAWHQFMQTNYKLEYAVYNLFDCISLEELDKKTTDLAITFSILCEHSDFKNFVSQPRRIVDDLHFFVQEQTPPRIMATTSDSMLTEEDELVIGMKDWIVTLPAHLVEDNGLKLIKELPNIRTGIRIHVFDLDVEGTYPNIEYFMNISKETTRRELSSIRGVDEHIRRSIGINLTGGKVNAVEICCNVYKLPSFNDLLNDFTSI